MPGFLGGAGVLRSGRAQHGPRRGRAGPLRRVLGARPPLELPRGPHRRAAAARAQDPSVAYGTTGAARAVDGRSSPGSRRRTRLTSSRLRARAHGARLVRGDRYGLPGPQGARAEGDLRRALARRADHHGVRRLGLRRQPDRPPRRGLQPVRRRSSGFDTRFALGVPGAGAAGSTSHRSSALLSGVSGAPYMNAIPLTPETFQVPPVFGVGAYYRSGGHRPARGAAAHAQHRARPAAAVLARRRQLRHRHAGRPRLRADQRSRARRNFRRQLGAALVPARERRVLPRRAGRREELPVPGRRHLRLARGPDRSPLHVGRLRAAGRRRCIPWRSTSRVSRTRRSESEVTDIAELARTMFDAPADFIEQYFPTAITADVGAVGEGDRSGSLAGLRYNGIPRRPAMLIQAGDSNSNAGVDSGPPIRGEAPNDQPLQPPLDTPRLQPPRRADCGPCAERRPARAEQHGDGGLHAGRGGAVGVALPGRLGLRPRAPVSREAS